MCLCIQSKLLLLALIAYTILASRTTLASLEEKHKNVGGSPTPLEVAEQKSNGSAILEDLVNQFLEKNREAVKSGKQALDLESIQASFHGTPVERSSGEEISSQENESSGGSGQLAAQVFGTGSQSLNQAESDELAPLPAVEQQQPEVPIEPQETADDRHIQYDIVRNHEQQQQQPSDQQIYTSLSLDGSGSRHLSDYKLATESNANYSSSKTIDNHEAPLEKAETTLKPKVFDDDNEQQRQQNSSSSIDSPVTLNSTNVVDVVAPSPLIDEQQIVNITGRSSGGVQARSMYSTPSKTPQHTRPPYATHDTFNHNKVAASAEYTNPSTDGSTTATKQSSSLKSAANSSSMETLAAVASSDSQLIESVSSRSTDQVRQLAGSESSSRLTQTDAKLQKLTDSQLVDLNPMPASGAAGNRATINAADSHTNTDRLHFSKENSLFNLPNRAHNDRYSSSASLTNQGDLETRPQSYEQPANSFNDLTSGFYLSGKNLEHQVVERDSKIQEMNHLDTTRSTTSTQAPHLSGYASNRYNNQQQQQLEAAESQQHSSGERDSSLGNNRYHQAPTASGSLQVIHRTAPPTHYVAHLFNVTAPMVLPLSASESMESALGGGQAAKTLLNQVSGLLRPAPQGLDSSVVSSSSTNRAQLNVSSSSLGRQPQPQQAPQYYMPGFSGIESLSPPANQFSQLKPHSILNVLDSLTDPSLNSSAASLSNLERERMRLDGSGYIMANWRPPTNHYQPSSSPLNISQPQHQASGFRSPNYPHNHLLAASSSSTASLWAGPNSHPAQPSNYLAGGGSLITHSAASTQQQQQQASASPPTTVAVPQQNASSPQQQTQQTARPIQAQNLPSNTSASVATSTTNGFITGGGTTSAGSSGGAVIPASDASASASLNRRVFNLTRVEHISAECSNDLIRTVIVFNGTFKGIIYSSGYVSDRNCIYINGTGKTRYDFSIRLNQCGTLGRQETHPPTGPNEVRRRDQVMWNTLSIQYNPIIEQEWDEHFRVSCEYGSDFWKTVSFSPFNVETNTGAPVVFTVDPPQCQMEILRGHGMVGPRQEAVSGPVTVGDPLTLLIHMKSEKAGYDILVKNCIAHNGAAQKMQLIDTNGCVVNERFISPFRGTYNDNDLKHVTLYSYLKAFRFTGSPVLYLECEIHMCQSSCPPQMCYWRRLSKRSANESSLIGDNSTRYEDPLIMDESPATTTMTTTAIYQPSSEASSKPAPNGRRKGRQLVNPSETKSTSNTNDGQQAISDKVSLFQALEVRQERQPDAAPYSLTDGPSSRDGLNIERSGSDGWPLMCYRRAEVLAFLFTAISLLLVALSVTVGCCWRAANLRRLQDGKKRLAGVGASFTNSSAISHPMSSPLSCSSYSSYASNGSISGGTLSPQNNNHPQRTRNELQQAAAVSSRYLSQSSTAYRKELSSVGPIMVLPTVSQHHSKQRHKECLISPSY